ncbi:MAG: nuclear transport factor 2 family protein [Acidobacteriia bacterium]|nr:nuclear transport factor 2 family protein [Terriglobia bacterium]
MIILPLLAALALQVSPRSPDQITALLRAKDQMLLDAIAAGDRKVWDQALAADAVIVDESGAVIDRAEYLKQVEPLPAGASGTIHISSYTVHISGDLAAVIHTDDEQENYHGQSLTAQYLTTETWQREAGEWKIHLMHVYAVLKDPPAISLPHETVQQYVGRYQAAPDLIYVIQWGSKQLVGGRDGSPMKPLEVELRDVLFVPGQPRIRKIFQRDEAGHITGFVDRRESWDLVWRRQPSGHLDGNAKWGGSA